MHPSVNRMRKNDSTGGDAWSSSPHNHRLAIDVATRAPEKEGGGEDPGDTADGEERGVKSVRGEGHEAHDLVEGEGGGEAGVEVEGASAGYALALSKNIAKDAGPRREHTFRSAEERILEVVVFEPEPGDARQSRSVAGVSAGVATARRQANKSREISEGACARIPKKWDALKLVSCFSKCPVPFDPSC
ncbi:hypothetical protein B0H19DRAFT_1241339 [Mycena capillaripes]|nr:hypothetical protein B0H19DRAFT_1241339 [Mycena capillaripes]